MNLITVHQQEVIGTEEVNSVNARDLYKYLEIKQDFSGWIKAQLGRGRFVEPRDYVLLTENSEQKQGSGGHNAKDYLLTVDTAKHIALMSGTDKGFEVRDYFIEIEKQHYALMEVIRNAIKKHSLGMPQETNKRRVGTRLSDREKAICEMGFQTDQTNAYLSRVLGCDPRTVGRYRAEYEDGEQAPELAYHEEQEEVLPLYDEEV